MINIALRDVAHQVSADRRKRSNIPGLVTARLREFKERGLPQIPSGVDENLMKDLGFVDNYEILAFISRVSLFVCLRSYCMLCLCVEF